MDSICKELSALGLTLHQTPQKNWDHHQLLQLLKDVPKDAHILDLGSGGGYTLKVLHESGYVNMHGIDLQAPPRKMKNHLMRVLKPSSFQPCFIIENGDICDTKRPAASYDFMTCVSVLEHGVDVDGFLKEASRILKPGGVLFITVDYWEDYELPEGEVRAVCGLPWNIFNRMSLQEAISTAAGYGLEAVTTSDIPAGEEKTVSYAGQDYTFVSLALKKASS